MRTKTIFVDRDGVINKDPGGWTRHSYVTDWNEFRFLPGALEALKILNENGVRVIVISNQAGVSKGFFTKETLDEINKRMLKEIRRNGGGIEAVYYCIHRQEDNCECRKPRTGLIRNAIRKYGITAASAYFIGDSHVDVVAGKEAGLKTIFVLSGKTAQDEMMKWEKKPDYVFEDLLAAVRWLVAKERRRSDRASRRGKKEAM
jgi:histidinol-phosphate phosphatase family protein